MNTLNFANQIQVALFVAELQGQLSDGMWENTRPYDHWKLWCNATITCDNTKPTGRNFHPSKDRYDISGATLLSIIGDRMLNICNLTENGFSLKIAEEFNEYKREYMDISGPNEKFWMDRKDRFVAAFGTYDNYIEQCKGSYNMKKMIAELKDMKIIMRKYSNF